jgi:FKBP-type peptidyl-prolyl cis-trans isomerase
MGVKEHGRRIAIFTIVGAFVLSSVGFSGLVVWDLTRNKDSSQQTSTEDIQKQLQEQLANQNKEGKLESTDIKIGEGAEASPGKKVTVHYTGTLTDGKKFDSSLDRNQPFTFELGSGQVIQGWDQGVVGMKVGGKRKLVIPASLAYGEQSPSPDIPPNSTLVFEIELLEVK